MQSSSWRKNQNVPASVSGFFDNDDERILACFFTKMYDEDKNLKLERKKLYDDLLEKYGQKIEIKRLMSS